MFTKGKRVVKERKVEITNPYNDQVFQTLGMSDGQDVNDAIATAHKGFEILRRMPAGDRAHILEKTSDIIKKRKHDKTSQFFLYYNQFFHTYYML